jgi:hypothetical protein
MRSRECRRSDVEIGHDSMVASHLGNMAQRLGSPGSPEKEMTIGDAKAQKLVSRSSRARWKLSAV